MTSRYLKYESQNRALNKNYTEYGQITQIISDRYVNVNIEGAQDSQGNLLLLEQVAIVGDYVPKLGDWVGIDWRDGQPVAIGNSNSVGSGLNDINNDVKVVSPTDMANEVIQSDHIQAESILAKHIKAGEVQADHIQANAIDATKIKAGEIQGYHISANSIDASKLVAGSITAQQISANAITANELAAGSVTARQIAAGAITAVAISANSIDASRMVVGTITAQSGILASASVGTANIIDGSITNAKIGNAEITGAKIAEATIDTAQIKDAAITNAKIVDLNAGKITAGYLDVARIQAGTITGQLIAASTISGGNIMARTIDSGQIKAGAVTATEIAASTITGDKIQAGSITGEQIHAGSINTEHISTVGLDAQSITVYNSQTGQTLIGSGYLRVDGMDVGVVQSDNLVNNGLFLVNSQDWGLRRTNNTNESVLGAGATASGGNTVWKYDLSTPIPTLTSNNLIAGKKPSSVLPSSDGLFLYVANQGGGTVSKIDLAAGAEVAHIITGAEPTVMKFTPDNKYILVMNSDLNSQVEPDTISVIDTETFTKVKDLIVGSSPFDVAMGSTKAYITTSIDGDIYILDLAEMKITGSIPTGLLTYPTGIDISADEQYLYVGHGLTDSLGKYDVATGELVAQITVGDAPSFIKHHNGKIYVACSGGNSVAVVDEATFTKIATIDAGIKPVGLALNPYAGTDGYLYVASSGINQVLIVDLASGAVIGVLQAGANVIGVALSPDYKYLYMANNGDSSFISFTYPTGGFIGDAFIATDGTTSYYGADGWMPDRSERMYDGSGSIIGAASAEFHIGENLNNESGFARLVVLGAVDQYAQIEQDVSVVTNFSDGHSASGTWFRYHNVSAQMMMHQPAAPNVVTKLEVDELVPKFIVVEDTQTTAFTPTSDGINQQYSGLVLSSKTNRLLNISQGACDSSTPPTAPNSPSVMCFVDGDYSDSEQYLLIGSGDQWLSVDMGDVYMLNKIQMWRYFADGRTYNGTKLEVSTDNTNWITVYDQAVMGGYVETADGKTFEFPAVPARYIRAWSNGNDKDNENRYVEIQAFADWKLETAPLTTILVNGTPMEVPMTNNGTHITTDVAQAYVEYEIDIEFLSDWYYTYLTGSQYGTCRLYIDDSSQKRVDGITNLYIFQNSNTTAPTAYQGTKLKPGHHKIRIEQSTGKISFDRFRFEDFQYFTKSSTLFSSTDITWDRVKLVPTGARSYVGQGRQSTSGAFDTQRVNPATGLPDGSVPIKYRIRVRTDLVGSGQASAGITYVTGVICEQGKLTTHWRMSQSGEMLPTEKLEIWNDNKPFTTGIQTKHIADGAVMGTKIRSHSISDFHLSPYAKIAEFKLDLNYPTHGHSNKDVLDGIVGFSGNGTSNSMARADHNHDSMYYTKTEIDQRMSGAGGSGDVLASGNNTFYGTNTFMQTVTMMGDLNVSGNINYHGNNAVVGDQSVSGSLTVGGQLILNSQATTVQQAVRADRLINAGNGLSGGGNLTSDVTLSVAFSGSGVATTVSRSDHSHSNYVRTDLTGQSVQGNFSVASGNMFIGSSSMNNGGALTIRDMQGLDAIQIDATGAVAKQNVKTYIGASGNAKFNGKVQVSTLVVDNSTLVQNLNAQYINGIKEADLAKSASILELGGYGVLNGMVATQTLPTPTMAVALSAGTVYTKSGRRVTFSQQNVSLSPASATGDRYDIIYVTGASDALGEGFIKVVQGTPAANPIYPDTPLDAIRLARILVKQNASTITDGSDGTADLVFDMRDLKTVYNSGGVLHAATMATSEIYPYAGSNEIVMSAPMSCDGYAGQWAGSVTIPAGQTKVTYSHGCSFASGSYTIGLSSNSPNRHAYWSNKQPSSVDICIDDATDTDIIVDVTLFGLQ